MMEPWSAMHGGFSDIAGYGDAAGAVAVSAELIGILDTVDLPIVVITSGFKVARFNRAAASALSLTASHIGQSPHSINVFADLMDLEELCDQAITEGCHAGEKFVTTTGGLSFGLPRAQEAMIGVRVPCSR